MRDHSYFESGIHVYGFYRFNFVSRLMTLKLKARDYGFEDDFVAEGEVEEVIEAFRKHMEEIHGIDYTVEAVTQMITNRGHSLESIKK